MSYLIKEDSVYFCFVMLAFRICGAANYRRNPLHWGQGTTIYYVYGYLIKFLLKSFN